MLTNENFTLVRRVTDKVCVVVDNVKIEYKYEEPRLDVDDKIYRISKTDCGGGLLESHGTLVMRSNVIDEDTFYDKYKTRHDKLEALIGIYFGISPIISYTVAKDGFSTNDFRMMCDHAHRVWSNRLHSRPVDYRIIYQCDETPLRIPNYTDIEIYESDFSVFGIDYAPEIPGGCLENGVENEIYSIIDWYKVENIIFNNTETPTKIIRLTPDEGHGGIKPVSPAMQFLIHNTTDNGVNRFIEDDIFNGEDGNTTNMVLLTIFYKMKRNKSGKLNPIPILILSKTSQYQKSLDKKNLERGGNNEN